MGFRESEEAMGRNRQGVGMESNFTAELYLGHA